MKKQVLALVIGIMGTVSPALAGEGPAVAQESQAEQRPLYAWSGKAPDVKSSLKELAVGRVARLVAGGDFRNIERSLNRTLLMATATVGFEGQEELLVQATIARVELYAHHGQLQKAVDVAQVKLYPGITPDISFVNADALEQATPELLKLVAKANLDPRVVKKREEVVAQLGTGASDSLAAIVGEAFSTRSYHVIHEIGAPAQHLFAKEILREAEEFPSSAKSDPLYVLIKMNERKAAEILLANLDKGGYLWKRRIMRVMEYLEVMNNPGTWSSSQPFVCLEPDWLSVIEALLSSPETALQSVPLLSEPFLRDQLSPGIQQAVVRGLQNYDVQFVDAVFEMMDTGDDLVVDSALPIFEAAATHGDVRIQRLAARALSNFELNPILLGMAQSEDPEVRTSVVRVLQPSTGRFVYRYQDSNQYWHTNGRTRNIDPAIGERERTLLVQYTRDPALAVRVKAAYALRSLATPLAAEVYLALAKDEKAPVREKMVITAFEAELGSELRSTLLSMLSVDGDSEVRERVDNALLDAPLASDPGPYLEALRIRLTDPRTGMSDSDARDVMSSLARTSAGLSAVAEWVDGRTSETIRALYYMNYTGRLDNLLSLDDRRLGMLFAGGHEGRDRNLYNGIVSVIKNARPSRHEAMQLLMGNEAYSVPLRLEAAKLAAELGGTGFAPAFLALLQNEHWGSKSVSKGELEDVGQCCYGIPDPARNAMILEVIQNRSIHDAVAQSVAGTYSKSAPLSVEVTSAILARWFAKGRPYSQPVDSAIYNLAALGVLADSKLLAEAVFEPGYTTAAASTMRALRRPEFLPLLAQCLEPKWLAPGRTRDRVSADASMGIAGYLSDEAAAVLLTGMGSADSDVRKVCSDALSYMEKTRESIRRWEQMKTEQPTKASALAELLEMIDHENLEIRVQAIRGIATFGAVEYLPTLIRLLSNPESKIVDAARAAIDTLTEAALRAPVASDAGK